MITRPIFNKIPFLFESFFTRPGFYFYSTNKNFDIVMQTKIKDIQEKTYKNELSFEDFKNKNIEDFNEYKRCRELIGIDTTDTEKITKAYKNYCLSLFNSYRIRLRGENPGKMI